MRKRFMKGLALALAVSLLSADVSPVFAATTANDDETVVTVQTEDQMDAEDAVESSVASTDTTDVVEEDSTGNSVTISDTVISCTEDSNYTYQMVSDGTIRIYEYNGTEENYTIPSTLDGYTVSRVYDNAFSQNDNIKSIHIPENIVTIGPSSLGDLANLAEITVDEGNDYYYTIDNVLYRKYTVGNTVETWIECYPLAKEGETFAIPSNANVLGYAFSTSRTYKYLKTIIIPNTIHGAIAQAFYLKQAMNIVFTATSTSTFTDMPTQVFSKLVSGTKVYVKNDEMKTYLEGKVYDRGCDDDVEFIVDDGTGEDSVYNHATSLKFTNVKSTGKAEAYLLNDNSTINVLIVGHYTQGTVTYDFDKVTTNGEYCTDTITTTKDTSINDGGEHYIYTTESGCKAYENIYVLDAGLSSFTLDSQTTVATGGEANYEFYIEPTTGIEFNSTAGNNRALTFSCEVEDTSVAEATGEIGYEGVYFTAKKAGTTKITISATYIDGVTYTASTTVTVNTDVVSEDEDEDDEDYNADDYNFNINVPECTITSQTYTGSNVAVDAFVWDNVHSKVLSRGVDYTVGYTGSIKNAGTTTITITGMGSYSGKTETTLTINPASMFETNVSTIASQTYTGSQIKPSVGTITYNGMTLKEGTDYTLSYGTNKTGQGTVKITGKGNYTDTKTMYFKIGASSISKATVSAVKNYTYTGKAITPTVTVKSNGNTLKKGTDYAVSYKNNKNAGTATITIKGINNYTGTKKVTFKITQKSAKLTATSSYTKTYGSSRFSLGIKNSGTGKVTYTTSNKKIATVTSAGKVTIKGYGKVTITVKAAKTTNYKATSKKITVTVIPKTLSSVKAVSSKTKTVKVSWKKISNVTGYQVQYSKKSSFKSATTKTIKTAKTTSYTISKLKKGTTYYVRVRAYKTVSGKKYYGSWKTVKVKCK